MTSRDDIVEWLDDKEGLEPILLWDGLEEAFVGVVTDFHRQSVACYDYDKIVDLLMSRDGMEWHDAVEHVDFNIAGGYLGEQTPLILTRYR